MAATAHFKALTLLLQSAKYSDLTLCCGDREFAVHRAIEASSGRIELKDDDPETVERMISFMYSLDYQDEQRGNVEAARSSDAEASNASNSDATVVSAEREVLAETLVNNNDGNVHSQGDSQPTLFSSVRVYAIADKYNVQSLKDLAKQRFGRWARRNWACADFTAIIREVFNSTPSSDRGLRDIVSGIVANHSDFFIQKDGFRELVEDVGELGLGMLDKLMIRHMEENSALLLQIQSLEAEIGVSKLLQGKSKQALARKSSELDAMMSRVNDLSVCRHCNEDFNIEVEDHFPGRAIIRCRKCRTRH
ncbi:hypothetical protein EPUS_08304 [Endocarpon pusillum Z07020]|uniref:BTB domain-containing protein n=1 Tax=Endocarpon pusillum (strain Z07020 / HMAS-L-300199) TaxID=1263415 RepID=U1HXD8_ENDPU|nr:uncharacterized protein EPUS_08304 [Endocarpon pusillum Z07020]ERF75490.1 hypothetical protein EPUS_08304 [Endocarpon pusillum Z07020]